jgi:glycerophosphoryl diester phosphodiesterase
MPDPALRRPLRLAHRGDWRHAAENTLPALLAALAVPGCDGVEFDVRAAADGTPVLLHDATLLRVRLRPGRVDRLLPAELARHGIPTLAEVLAALPPEAFLDVELKGDPGEAVVATLEAGRGPLLAGAVVSSFEPATIERIRAARPAWATWLNADDLAPATIARAVDLGCVAVSAPWEAIDATTMAMAGEAGLAVAAWTVRDPATFHRLAALGVAAVCVEGAALDA